MMTCDEGKDPLSCFSSSLQPPLNSHIGTKLLLPSFSPNTVAFDRHPYRRRHLFSACGHTPTWVVLLSQTHPFSHALCLRQLHPSFCHIALQLLVQALTHHLRSTLFTYRARPMRMICD